MSDDKLKNSKFVKTILMLLVILGHACAFWSGHWFTENPVIQSNGVNTLYAWLNSFHIYAFTLVSGYIFAFKTIGGGYGRFVPFLKNKAKRLLVPYVFVMLIWVAPISAYYFGWDVGYLIQKYVLCINPSQLWFLWMLFDVFVIVWLLRRTMMRSPIIGWGLSTAFYCVGILGNRLLPNVICIWTACQYVPMFYVGMRIRQKEENGEKRITEQFPWYLWIIADGMLFAGVTLVSQMDGAMWSLISISLNFVLHIVGAVMAWTVLQSLAAHVKWKDSRCFMTLSAYSMPMYLFHQQIIYLTIVLLNGRVNPWLHAGINFAVAFIGSILISAILMHWKITRNLVGEK